MKRLALLPAIAALAIGCGGTSATSTPDMAPAWMPLDPPSVGQQLATTHLSVPAGQEEYQCWSFAIDANKPLSLVGLENKIPSAGVHHWAVFTSTKPITQAGPWECSKMDGTWGLVAGGGLMTPGLDFPSGTAMTLKPGEQIIFQLHLLNAQPNAIDVQPAYVNLKGAASATGLQEVGLVIAGTLDIHVPAHSSGVTESGGCALSHPLDNVFAYFPHMHQHGRRITAMRTPVGTQMAQMVSDHVWDFADQAVYPITDHANTGDQIQITCTFDNTGDTDIYFGESSNDEMCIQVLFYYPAADPTHPSEYCGFGN